MAVRLLLATAYAALTAHAQQQPSTAVGVHNLTVEAGSCGRFRLSTDVPERASYSVVTLPAITDRCLDQPILQALPQSTKHLALASFDEETPCEEVLSGKPQRTSYSTQVDLDFVDSTSLAVQGLTYHVCTDVAWEQGVFGSGMQVGPVDTFLWFQNPCNVAATVRFSVSLLEDVFLPKGDGQTVLPDSAAQRYCDKLQAQNSAEEDIAIIVYFGRIIAAMLFCFGLCLCTSGCTACCCCARDKWCPACASACSKGCYSCWGSCLLKCGCGWCMGKHGGIAFYTANPKRGMLFWTFAAACMSSLYAINLPTFDRTDTINPDFQDSRETWGGSLVEADADIPAVRFLGSIIYSISAAMLPYGAIVLSFSDPLRDKSFRSKAVVAGSMIGMGMIYATLSLTDVWRYYSLWKYKGHQIAIQFGVVITNLMSLVSFISFAYEARKQRASVRKQHGGQLPHILAGKALTGRFSTADCDLQGTPELPVAAVIDAAAGDGPPVGTPASSSALSADREAAPVVPVHASHAPQNSGEINEAAPNSGGAMLQPHARVPSNAEAGAVAESIERVDGNGKGESSEEALGLGVRLGGGSKHGRHASEPVVEDDAEEAAEADSQRQRHQHVNLVKKLWDSVREDPASGFRYSVFVGASLLVTFITLTAALLRALRQVRRLAACSEAESTCLYNVQRFVYKRLVRNFVKVDAETLELQASGLCRTLAASGSAGNVTSIDPFDSRWHANLVTAEVVRRCADVQQLEDSQAEFDHPEWLAKAKYPVLVGGHIGFVVAYCLGLYTIFHVARAYKKLELKLKAARLVEVLWQRRSCSVCEVASTTTASQAPAPSTATLAATHKSKLGRDIVEDYKLVKIGQSAYFTGTLVSTCFVQLWLAGLILGSVIMLLLHPVSWDFLWKHHWWPASVILIIIWHIVSQVVLNKYITDGKRIKWPFWWMFLYVGLSAGYCVVSLYLALWRLIHLLLTSIVALSRLDSCLFTVLKGADRGYASFLAMALMLHSFQDCLKEQKLCKHDDAAAASATGSRAVEPSSRAEQRQDEAQHALQSV